LIKETAKEKAIKALEKIIEFSLYGLILFIPISKGAIEFFAAIAILSFIAKKMLKPDFLFLKNNAHLFLLLFVLFNALSLFNSGVYFRKSFNTLFFKWWEYILIFLVVEDALITQQKVRKAIRIFLVVAAVVGIDAFFQKVSGFDFLRHKQIGFIEEGVYALTGSFNHYNSFSAYLISVLPLAIVLFVDKLQKIIVRIGVFLLIVLLIGALLFTFSRGGWVGFLAAGLLMNFLLPRKKISLAMLSLFMFSLVIFSSIGKRAIFIFQGGGDMGRFEIWRSTWIMIKENPFLGKGIGTYMDYLSKYSPSLGAQYAHNSFLQIWAETGIFSLLSFLCFIFTLVWQGIKAFKITHNYLLLGILSSLFGFLTHSFFDNHFYSLQLSMLFWVFLGILSVCSSRKNEIASSR